ncbi:MAG: asparagine synthase (glutamine-hydrolyzing) [Acidobacteriota bacterium]|nr:asparagine synthase (glutamine-hydrolyzing) [Acidobacteriota bacterium]
MCGLTGVLGRPGLDPERAGIVREMTATLIHRGPDGEGYAHRDACDLGFRRLAIVDLNAPSPPFANEDATVWTVCNGEIYNGDDLRSRLEARGHVFHTRVDTEVIPHLYEEHGPDLVDHLDGMFAFAIWDEPRRTLVLGRDRAGEKPLFYWKGDGELVFASELRALMAHPRVPRAVNPVALRRYLLHDFFPAPYSPIAGIRKLPAGHLLIGGDHGISIRKYWDLADHFDRGRNRRSTDDIVDELDERIAVAVRRRRASDVPVGVFLSGGIDSSTVLAHMAEQVGPGVPVFSLGHAERSFDEARFAKRTAEHFGADFHELILDERDLDDGLRRVGEGFDEPLGDASTIPTHLLSRYARQRVKVVLSGEGADELFAGYPTYIGNRVADAYGRLPGPVRRALARAIPRLFPVSMGNVGLDYLLSRFLAGADRPRVERHHTWFGSTPPALQSRVLARPVLEACADDDPFETARMRLDGRRLPDGLAELLYTDFTMYLQDDLLTKVDRASMLVSLEARGPFLDHELAEFVAGLPSRQKLSGFTTKAVLRRAVRRRLPKEVLQRRKRGFNIPFSRWLLHGLGDRLRERFSTERIRERGLLSPEGVAALLDEHLDRRADHRKPLFTLLALDLWCDRTYGVGTRVPLERESSSTERAATGSSLSVPVVASPGRTERRP